MVELFADVGRTLTLLRDLRGLSQAALAWNAGIGKSQLSKYENGKEKPKLESLSKLLAVLEVQPLQFFFALAQLPRSSRVSPGGSWGWAWFSSLSWVSPALDG